MNKIVMEDGNKAAKQTTLLLPLIEEDKRFLKAYAAMHSKTVAGIIKDWNDNEKRL